MTTRAVTATLAVLAVAALAVTLVASLVGGPATPRRETVPAPTTSSEPTTATPEPDRVAQVPDSPEQRRAMRVLTDGCRYSPRGIPECGTLLGAAYGANTNPQEWERSLGRGLGLHRTYFAADEVNEAVWTARDDLEHQRMPWISFKVPRSWADMAAGDGDDWALDIAGQLADLPGPVWVAFHHEPEGDGDITQWTAMQEHLAPLVRETAPNVAYTVILTGWNQLYGSAQLSLDSLWPDAPIDLVGFDVYDKYGVERDGAVVGERTRFADYFTHFQEFGEATGVAWALAETGYTDRAAEIEPDFVAELVDQVAEHGGVGVTYFNTTLNSVAPWHLTGAKETEFARALASTPTL